MEKRVELEKRGKNPAEIKELNLDNCRSTNIVGLSDEFENLESLSLINVGLTSLKGFPRLPNLKKLELSDNRLSGGFDILETSPKLAYLNLSGNRIKDIESLEPLKPFKNLRNLDLFNNEATSTENYREKIFKMLPNLKYLDGFDAEDHEVEESDGEEEVNGNGEEESNDDDPESSAEEEEDELDDSVDLGVVYSENLDELSDEGDYEGGEEDDEDEEIVEDEEDDDDVQVVTPNDKGKKRKREDGEEN